MRGVDVDALGAYLLNDILTAVAAIWCFGGGERLTGPAREAGGIIYIGMCFERGNLGGYGGVDMLYPSGSVSLAREMEQARVDGRRGWFNK